MNELVFYFSLIYILAAAFMIARPWLSRKNVLFGVVFGSGDIRKNPEAKSIVRRFVGLSAVLAAAPAIVFFLLLAAMPGSDAQTAIHFMITIFALVFLAFIPFIIANRAIKALKETISDPNLVSDSITVEVGAGAERKRKPVSAAWFLILLAPVAVSVILAAVYYPSMPDPIATHFNAAGVADAWQAKSPGIVMFPITMQIILTAIFLFCGIFMRNASPAVKGSPGAEPGYGAFRRFLVYWFIGFGAAIQVNFIFIILHYAGVISNTAVWMNVSIPLIIVSVALLIAAFVRMRRRGPEGKVYDDDSRWKAGMFYFNPSDPSVFVEKRSGIGQTLNFGHPVAWIFIAGIAALIIFSVTLAAGK